jgi:hypothetical protein
MEGVVYLFYSLKINCHKMTTNLAQLFFSGPTILFLFDPAPPSLSGGESSKKTRISPREGVPYSLFPHKAGRSLRVGVSSKVLMAYLPDREWRPIIAKEDLTCCIETTLTGLNELRPISAKSGERGMPETATKLTGA